MRPNEFIGREDPPRRPGPLYKDLRNPLALIGVAVVIMAAVFALLLVVTASSGPPDSAAVNDEPTTTADARAEDATPAPRVATPGPTVEVFIPPGFTDTSCYDYFQSVGRGRSGLPTMRLVYFSVVGYTDPNTHRVRWREPSTELLMDFGSGVEQLCDPRGTGVGDPTLDLDVAGQSLCTRSPSRCGL